MSRPSSCVPSSLSVLLAVSDPAQLARSQPHLPSSKPPASWQPSSLSSAKLSLADPASPTKTLAAVREAVLTLRRRKGMVVDPDDPDSVSAGSFFTNPILDPGAFAALQARVREKLGPDAEPPSWPEADGRVKTSAAWLIERAGFTRGHGDAAISWTGA